MAFGFGVGRDRLRVRRGRAQASHNTAHSTRARSVRFDTSIDWRIMGNEVRVIVTTTRIVTRRLHHVHYMCHFTVAVSVRGSPGMLYRSALPCAAMK